MPDAPVRRGGVVSLSGTYVRPLVRPERPQTAGAEAVERALRDDITGFSFFQAVRLLERLHPDRAPVGGWADPNDEVLRFGTTSTLGFPPAEIHSLRLDNEGPRDEPARMRVHFLGLIGPSGVLPHVYTVHVAERVRARDTAFRDFLDMFHHRALSLFYRAWAKHRAAVAHESGGEDRLFDHLLDLSGMGTPGLRKRLPMPDGAIAYYAGAFASQTRSAAAMARVIGDYFDVPATIEQFVGEWRRVDGGGQCTLGVEDASGQLGFGVIGDQAWDPHSSVRLRLGPLNRTQFDAFLPGGAAHASLRDLARLYAQDQVGVQVQLVLARDEVAPVRLGAPSPDATAGTTLGRGTWLASRPLSRDPDETILALI